jgi:hypothetical protein
MMGNDNIHALLHGLLHDSFLYSYSKPSINLTYGSTVIWLRATLLLYAPCSTLSSASGRKSQGTIDDSLTCIHNIKQKYFLSLTLAPHLSRDDVADTGFLNDKVPKLWCAIKNTVRKSDVVLYLYNTFNQNNRVTIFLTLA